VRKLSADEQQMWARVAATIRPLSRDPVTVAAVAIPDVRAVAACLAKPRGQVPPQRAQPAPARVLRTLQSATLDGEWDKRLRSGSVRPDRTLDLHGHNLDRAWDAIDHTLEQAAAAGDRVILFITGHERQGEPPVARGRIRAAVHDWLAASRHASRIAAVRPAHGRHGGEGSLYIILRKS